jgi:hypothetical protein
MADTGHLVIQELQPTPTEQAESMPEAGRVTSVANPRRIRLTRLARETSASH